MTKECVQHNSLVIKLFGPFEVLINGAPMRRLRTRKGQWLLSLLVLRRGIAIRRSWLAGTLWPESSESQALANLRLSLTDLRQALCANGARLLSPSGKELAFDLTVATVDVILFDDLVDSSESNLLEKAVDLYRGQLLEGCDEEWVIPERASREHAYFGALEHIASHALSRGDPAQAVWYLRRAVLVDPLCESVQRLLMGALAAQGHIGEVTQVFRQLRLALHESLQCAPDPETVAVYSRLKSSAIPVALPAAPIKSLSSRPINWPAFPKPFTSLLGREAEYAELISVLRSTRLITLKGLGGSGKTRLAISVAEQLREEFDGEVWFISLAELADSLRLPETVRDALHLPADHSDPFKQIVDRLALQPALLVLDNYEHLIPKGVSFVRELLASVPQLHCLVTSRHSLNLIGEIEYPLLPLAVPDGKESLNHLRECSSVQLFLERALARRPGFMLTSENAGTIAALCSRLEGIPLAIELVAAWSDALTPTQMLARVEARFDFPSPYGAEMPARSRSLQSAFDSSYVLLDESERKLLRELSVFACGCTLEAVEKVCGASLPRVGQHDRSTNRGNLPAESMRESPILLSLKRLVEKSLLMHRDTCAADDSQKNDGGSRYYLHETTRQYAREQLSDKEREESECRHAEFYFEESLRIEDDIYANETYGPHYRRMMPDSENYNLALQRWQLKDADKAMQMRMALDNCNICPFTMQERTDWIEHLQMRTLPTATRLQSKLYYKVALWAYFRAMPVWVSLMEKACALAEHCSDAATLADGLYHSAIYNYEAGEQPLAKQRLEAALRCADAAGNPAQSARIRSQMVTIARQSGDLENARRMGEELLQYGRETSHWSSEAWALQALADCAIQRGDYAVARDYLEQALAAYPDAAWISRTNTLRHLGKLAAKQGEIAAAMDYLSQSLIVCRESDDLAHEAATYVELAQIRQRLGDDACALDDIRQAIRLFDMIGEPRGVAGCLLTMAKLTAAKHEQALYLWTAFERLANESGYSNDLERRSEAAEAVAKLQTALSETVFSAIQESCKSMTWREVLLHAHLR